MRCGVRVRDGDLDGGCEVTRSDGGRRGNRFGLEISSLAFGVCGLMFSSVARPGRGEENGAFGWGL